RDVATVAPGVEDAKAPPFARSEIERVLDDGAEPGGLDRKRIVALIARAGSPIARAGVVVLVIGQKLAQPQIALGGAAPIAIDRGDPGKDRTAGVETDILGEKIAQRCFAR